MLKCSVMLTTYDKVASLRQVLDAIFLQVVPFDWEVVVVNDGPNPATLELLEEFCVYPNFNYYTTGNKAYRNPAAARNVAYRECKGEVVVSTCDDIVPQSNDVVARLVNELQPNTFLLAKVLNYRGSRYITDYCSLKRQAPFFFLGSALRKDLYSVGCYDEEFVHPDYDDNWLADCLMKGRGLQPEYSTDIVAHHLDHGRSTNSHARAGESLTLYKSKVAKGIWEASGGPWEYSNELQ